MENTATAVAVAVAFPDEEEEALRRVLRMTEVELKTTCNRTKTASAMITFTA